MISSSANVVAQRGKTRRTRAGGLLVHTTGSGLVNRARRLGKDPQQDAVSHYRTMVAYPHYLIDWEGNIYSFCDELRWAAHAKWSAQERVLYSSFCDELQYTITNRPSPPEWMFWWDDVIRAGGMQRVLLPFYEAWRQRWLDSRLYFPSPLSILRHIGGGEKGPNEVYIGVEMLDHKPSFTDAQHRALADLFSDCANRHNWCNPKDIGPDSLPVPFFCGHSDVSPIRRWARRKDGWSFPFDPLPDQLDWRKIERYLA